MSKAFFVIPAYNEEENITSVLEEWYPEVEKCGADSRLVVIDDGSKDNTYKILEDFAANHAQMIAVTKPNSGHGATILYGYKYAIENNADYIFQTDSDGQTLAAEFGSLWDDREKYDMIIGHRKNRQDGFSRIFVTKTLKFVVWLCFRTWVKDANTPFRLMKADSLKRYIDLIPKDYFLSNVLISVIFAKNNLAVKYVPITFRPRQGGVNSINMKRIVKIGQNALKDFSKLRKTI